MIGLDLTPELLEKARARSRAAGVEADWQEGDAERLPFDDNSFDRVLSTFGVQFAHDQCRAAAELVRVCRRGGLIGVCSWTREGVAGQYIELLMRRVGSRDVGSSPTQWGNEDCVRRLFAGAVDELGFELDRVVTEHESVDASMEFLERNYGCAITLRRELARKDGGRHCGRRSASCSRQPTRRRTGDSSRPRSTSASSRARHRKEPR